MYEEQYYEKKKRGRPPTGRKLNTSFRVRPHILEWMKAFKKSKRHYSLNESIVTLIKFYIKKTKEERQAKEENVHTG